MLVGWELRDTRPVSSLMGLEASMTTGLEMQVGRTCWQFAICLKGR